jgi:hypothetical protein
MGRRKLILFGASLVLLLALVLWLWPRRASAVIFGVGCTPLRGGHVGNFYSERFTVMMVTNSGLSQIVFQHPTIERQGVDGIVVTLLGQEWVFAGPVLPGGTASIPVEVKGDVVKFRVTSEYQASAGLVAELCSRILKLVPRKVLPQWLEVWFFKRGWITGSISRSYAGRWVEIGELRPAQESGVR